MPSANENLVEFTFGQPWTHRGETYKAGDKAMLTKEDVRMLTEDFKAHEAASAKPAKPAK